MAHWEKEVSTFPRFYSEPDTIYMLEGKVRVVLDEGYIVAFGKGDLVSQDQATPYFLPRSNVTFKSKGYTG